MTCPHICEATLHPKKLQEKPISEAESLSSKIRNKARRAATTTCAEHSTEVLATATRQDTRRKGVPNGIKK